MSMPEKPDSLKKIRSTETDPITENILVVEDDQTVREYLEELFSANGYMVRTASSGKEALLILDNEYFPLIITDLRLPDLPGMEILNYVQSKDMNTAVLIITGYASMDSVIQALRQGAYDYLTKPFSPQILLHRVARAFEKIHITEIRRDISSRIVYATEEERRRISRDVHDVLGQSLAVIKLTLKAIRHQVADSEEEILSDIDGLSSHVEETMKEISRITKNLSPSYVSELGFSKALSLYIETFSKKTGVQVYSILLEWFSLKGPQHEIHLYRIVQEALTNVAKHACATRVYINLITDNDMFYFSIEDNGRGLDKTQEEDLLGLGLIGMKERAAILGGKLIIESAPGQKTTIKVEVPYESVSFQQHN